MRFEPTIDLARLKGVIARAYGMRVVELNFVPASSNAACYKLTTGANENYFLKLWLQMRIDSPDAAKQHTSLRTVRALHDLGLGLRLPYPILTLESDLWAELSGAPFALAPFLHGAKPTEPWPSAVGQKLGRAIATLHGATATLTEVQPQQERLDIGFEPALRSNLALATGLGMDSRPSLLELRDWLLARQDNIRLQMKRLHDFQFAAQQIQGPFVLCHTDLHHNNLLVDEAGTLAILDWDDVKLAPPEHDLWSGLGKDYRGEVFSECMQAYREASGASPLFLEHFAFYLLRRYLEDLNVCVSGLLRPSADGREDGVLLYGVGECFSRWLRLDETLTAIAATLRQTLL
jgi:aminoglycoside phosphotransferase (APT) family kinase protein